MFCCRDKYTVAILHVLYSNLSTNNDAAYIRHLTCSMILKSLKLDTRQMLIFWMIVTIISVTLMADWQSIGHDPCREGFPVNNSTAVQPHRDEYVSAEGGGQVCRNLSTSGSECFWNPNSRVTGEYCAECFKVCRSVDKSLNFVQFSIGAMLFAMTLSPFQISPVVLVSDVIPLKYQVLNERVFTNWFLYNHTCLYRPVVNVCCCLTL